MQDLVAAGGHAIALDVTDEKQVTAAVSRIMKEQGRIDVLVNNAGYGEYGAAEEIPMDIARKQFEVNVFGVAELTNQVLPHMRKAKKGTIINISSVVGKVYIPFAAWYVATKHALEGWSDCLRMEVAPFNIKVVIVEPGAIKTEFVDVVKGPMIERSKGSAYESQLNNLLKNLEAFEQGGSSPSVISNVIIKASESTNPKRRYVAGSGARPMFFARSWFGDAAFDAIMRTMI